MAIQLPQTQDQLDPSVLRMVRAIRTVESGGNYQASGDNATSTGAFQFQAPTWKAWAKQYLGNENAPMDAANQNKVAYSRVSEWKQQGFSPEQVAAAWNAGEGKAKDGSWKTNVGTTTRGGKPLAYDTPSYVGKVVNVAMQLKQQEAPAESPFPGVQTASADTGAPAPTGDPHQDALAKLTHFFNAVFPGQQVGEAIGTLAGYAASKANGTSAQYDTSAPTPLQVAGDVAQGALTVGSGLPEVSVFGKTVGGAKAASSVLGRIAQSTALGAGFGTTGAIAQGDTNIGDILHKTGTSALIGGAFGVAGEAVSGLLNTLPKRIAKNALNINPKVLEGKPGTIEKALDDIKFGTKNQMVTHSQNLLNGYRGTVEEILSDPKFDGVILKGAPAGEMVQEKFADSNLTLSQFKKTVKQVAPEAAGLFDRFMSEGLDMTDTYRLKSLLDQSTDSFYTRSAIPPFSKKVTVELANILRAAIREGAPEAAPILDKYTRELTIKKALDRIQKSPSVKIGLYDMLKVMLAHGAGLPILPTVIGQEVMQNRATQLNVAKALNKAAPAVTGAIKAAEKPTLTATSR